VTSTSEHFPHAADSGVRGRGATVEEAFAGAARALFALVVEDASRLGSSEEAAIALGPLPLDELLLDFLNELIYLFDTRRVVFGAFDLKIAPASSGLYTLDGRARGERYDASRHEGTVDPKGASYDALRVAKEDGVWLAQCVVDV
jgi:SHS2 domain-containing protein